MVLMDPWGDTLDSIPWDAGECWMFPLGIVQKWPENLCFEGRWSKPDLLPALQWCCCCDMP